MKLQDKYEYESHHYHEWITTNYGDVCIHPLGDTIMVRSAIGAHGEDRRYLTVNRVEISISPHCYKWDDGKWHVGEPAKSRGQEAWKARQSLYASRCDYFGTGGVSNSAEDKIVAEVERVVNEWAETHPDEIAEADRIHRAQGAYILAKQIDEYENALQTLRSNLDACTNGGDYKM
jgi:hypothetical protein